MMRDDDPDAQPDPAEVQPTDNSSGNPIDLDRLDDIEQEAAEEDPPTSGRA